MIQELSFANFILRTTQPIISHDRRNLAFSSISLVTVDLSLKMIEGNFSLS